MPRIGRRPWEDKATPSGGDETEYKLLDVALENTIPGSVEPRAPPSTVEKGVWGARAVRTLGAPCPVRGLVSSDAATC